MTNPPYCLAFCFLDFCLEGGNCPKIKQNPNPSPTWKIWFGFVCFGDPYGTRTHVTAVKGRCLNHLTNGPEKRHIYMCLYGSGTWIRTGDTSGMNRMLWPTELCRHMLFKQHRDSIRRHARCQQNFSVSESFLRVSLRPQAERYAAGSTGAPLRHISKCRWELWPISQSALAPTVPSSTPASTHSPAFTAVSSSRFA